jgi:hypothetical protein
VTYLRVVGVVLTATAVAAVAACGATSSASPGAASSTRAGYQGSQAFQAYAECLRQHGVTLPAFPSARPGDGSARPRPSGSRSPGPRRSDGAFGGGGFPGGFGFGDQAPPGVDQETWTKAQQACASVRPSRSPRDNGAIVAYRNCLSEHGVSVDGGFGRLDPNDPKVAAALKACEVLRPSNLPTARPSGS